MKCISVLEEQHISINALNADSIGTEREKCLMYGGDRDWHGNFIACKFFNLEDDMPEGQMNIFDYV